MIVLVAFGLTMLTTGLVNVSEDLPRDPFARVGRVRLTAAWTASGVGLVVGSLLTGALVDRRKALQVCPLGFVHGRSGRLRRRRAERLDRRARDGELSGFGNGVTFPLTVLIVQQHTVDRAAGRTFT